MSSDSHISSLSLPPSLALSSPFLAIRLGYSSAIVRCINGFADSLRQNRATAGSVSQLCSQLGIPAWTVDVRHEAAHNALPSLAVLRLASNTLMEFLKNEYWIQTCHAWPTTPQSTNDSIGGKDEAINLLLQYKSSAAAPSTQRQRNMSSKQTTKGNKAKKINYTSNTNLRVFQRTDSIDDTSSNSDDEFDDWDPLLGSSASLWTASIGTNINRFAALQEPTKKNKPLAKKKKNKNKKQKTKEKSQNQKEGYQHLHYAKEYVRHVPIQLGYSTALNWLVWGGIGGVPSGRGVLIPGSPVAFPASDNGIGKARDRYSPLILTICRAWPGFAPALLVHIVDFVLALEGKTNDDSSDIGSVIDLGKARKLYFLFSWVRFLLSWQFSRQLDPSGTAPTSKKGKGATKTGDAYASLASIGALKRLQYPLNSLCDRCSWSLLNGDNGRPLGATTQEILNLLESILGQQRVKNFGITGTTFRLPAAHQMEDTLPQESRESTTNRVSAELPVKEDQNPNESTNLSLDAMEALLAEDPDSTPAEEDKRQLREAAPKEKPESRLAWVRCESWDPCSIGTLPGYPV